MKTKNSLLSLVWVTTFVLLTGVAAGQTILFEDFSGGFGTTPPTGWTTSGGAALWRWDNPGTRVISAPMIAPTAICDSDNAGSGTTTLSTMTSPSFDTSTNVQVILEYDHYFRDLTSTISVEVFDGTVWNVAQTASGTSVGSQAVPNSESFDVTVMAGAATNAQVRYVYTAQWDWWWLVDNVRVYEPATIDLRMASIDAPVANSNACINSFNSAETVSVTMVTDGSLTLPAGTFVQLDLYLNGVIAASDFLFTANAITQGSQIPFTFTNTIDLSQAGNNTLTVTATLSGDQDPANDSQTLLLHETLQGVGFTESFDQLSGNNGGFTPTNYSVPPGFSNDPFDGASVNGNIITGWAPQSVPSLAGPQADHTQGPGGSGNYMFIEDSQNQTGSISLISPCLNTNTASFQPAISFWYVSPASPGASDDNLLSIDVIDETAGQVVTMQVSTFMGNGNSDWTRRVVDLSAFLPNIVRVVFRTNNNNGSNTDDVAIDDFAFIDQFPTPGQAPVPGLAVLDINNSVNVNSDPISFGLKGPYFTTVTQGDTLLFTMSGESLQPIILFAGALNPAIASYGGIGSIDVGGAIDPSTGLPTGLVLLADGTALGGFNPFFVISATGTTNVGFTVPNLPIGILSAFQCAMVTSTASGIALSNCVEVSVM